VVQEIVQDVLDQDRISRIYTNFSLPGLNLCALPATARQGRCCDLCGELRNTLEGLTPGNFFSNKDGELTSHLSQCLYQQIAPPGPFQPARPLKFIVLGNGPAQSNNEYSCSSIEKGRKN
jgi:hypothetical protein